MTCMYVNSYEWFGFIVKMHLKTSMAPAQIKNRYQVPRRFLSHCVKVRSSVLVSLTSTSPPLFYIPLILPAGYRLTGWKSWMKSLLTSDEPHRGVVAPASRSWIFRVFHPHADVYRLRWPQTHSAVSALLPPRWKLWCHQHLQICKKHFVESALASPKRVWIEFCAFYIIFSSRVNKEIKHFVWNRAYLFYLFWFVQNVYYK